MVTHWCSMIPNQAVVLQTQHLSSIARYILLHQRNHCNTICHFAFCVIQDETHENNYNNTMYEFQLFLNVQSISRDEARGLTNYENNIVFIKNNTEHWQEPIFISSYCKVEKLYMFQYLFVWLLHTHKRKNHLLMQRYSCTPEVFLWCYYHIKPISQLPQPSHCSRLYLQYYLL